MNQIRRTRLCVVCGMIATWMQVTLAQESRVVMEDMTWPEIEAAQKAGVDTAVVTVGATEQHGPQIAVSGDSVTGDCISQEVARRLGRALVGPSLRLGVSAHHMLFPGTITLRTEILADVLREYIHSLSWHGFRHIVVLPMHDGNFRTVERVVRQLSPLYPHVNIIGYSDAHGHIDVLEKSSRRLNVPLDAAGSHSGLTETAMILACRPELVRLEQAKQGFAGDAYSVGVSDKMDLEGTQAINPLGVIGDPRRATPELGRQYLQDLTDYLVDFASRSRSGWRPPVLKDLPYVGWPLPSGPMVEGIRHRRAGRYEEARAFFSKELELHPESAAPSIELSRTHVLAGNFAAARAALTPILTHKDPRAREQARDDMGWLDLYKGQFRSAIEHNRAAQKLRTEAGDPLGEAHSLFQIAYIQTHLGQFDEAAKVYEMALQRAPSVNNRHLNLQHLVGILEVRRGRLIQAGRRLRTLEDAVIQKEFAAHVRRLYHLNGEILLARGRVEDALQNLLPATAVTDHPFYRETLARAYLQAGRLSHAEAEYRHLLDFRDERLDDPIDYVKAHHALANVYEKMGRRKDAADMYRKFLSFWGEADTALTLVADAKARLGQ